MANHDGDVTPVKLRNVLLWITTVMCRALYAVFTWQHGEKATESEAHYHDRSHTLKSDEAKWPKMTKMTLTSSFLKGIPMIWTKTDEATDSSASVVPMAMTMVKRCNRTEMLSIYVKSQITLFQHCYQCTICLLDMWTNYKPYITCSMSWLTYGPISAWNSLYAWLVNANVNLHELFKVLYWSLLMVIHSYAHYHHHTLLSPSHKTSYYRPPAKPLN